MILTGIYFIIIVLALRYVRFFRHELLPVWSVPLAFLIKSLIGFVFVYMYIEHYPTNTTPSDAIRFMREAKILHQVFYQSPKDYFSLMFEAGNSEYLVDKYMRKTFLWDAGSLTLINDSKNVIKLHSVFYFFSNGSTMVHVFLMNLISLIGLYQLFHAIIPYTKIKYPYAFWALLLFPSILFWSSGLLKEPLLFLGIGLTSRAIFRKSSLPRRLIYGGIGALFLLAFKPYVFICIFPALAFYLSYVYLFKKRWGITLASLMVVGIILLVSLPKYRNSSLYYLSQKQYHFANTGKGGLYIKTDTCFYEITPEHYKRIHFFLKDTLVSIKQTTPAIYHARKNRFPDRNVVLHPDGKKWRIYFFFPGANSYFKTTPINYSFWQLMKNIPEALLNAYFRPFPFDNGSAFKYPAMFELWGLLLFIIYSFLKRRQINPETKGLVIALLIFSICLLLLIGWTISVSGAIFRYRFPAFLALLIIGFILFPEKNKFLSRKE